MPAVAARTRRRVRNARKGCRKRRAGRGAVGPVSYIIMAWKAEKGERVWFRSCPEPKTSICSDEKRGGREQEGWELTPNRRARNWVKAIQPTAATTSSTNKTMKKVPTGLTIFGHECGCGAGSFLFWGIV